jgi:prevent-host-death family protein
MAKVTIHQAKTNLSKLIRKASEGEDLVISRGAEPVARLVAIGPIKGKRRPGPMKGVPRAGPESFEPLTEDELSRWE